MMKQIPYGLTDFGRIQKENYYYVDKTMFIEKIEMQPSYLFLIRPRRFGKSLTLAMLEAYYDVRYAACGFPRYPVSWAKQRGMPCQGVCSSGEK